MKKIFPFLFLLISCAPEKNFRKSNVSPASCDIYKDRVEVRLLKSRAAAARYQRHFQYIKITVADSASGHLAVRFGGKSAPEEYFTRLDGKSMQYILSGTKANTAFLPLVITGSW